MKLRLTSNSIRLRLTRPDVAEVLLRKHLDCGTQVGPETGDTWVYRLEFSADHSALSVSSHQSQIVIHVPAKLGVRWAETSEVGLYGNTSWGLRVIVEKDFKCLDGQPAEDDSNAFEHPAAQTKAVVKSRRPSANVT